MAENTTGEKIIGSEQMYRLALENIFDLVFITDDAGRFTFICPNVPHILGYSIAEIETMGSISPLLGDTLFDIEDLAAQHEIKNIETEVLAKNGARFVYLVTVKRVSIRGGSILYVCRDITERKQMVETFRENTNLLDMILGASGVGIACASERKIVWANEAMVQLFGFDATEDYLGKDTRILYSTDEEYGRVGKIIYEMAPGKTVETDAVFRRYDDGSNFYAHVKVNFLDPARRSKALIVNIIDITERKKYEKAIQEREALLKVLLESTVHTVSLLDAEGIVLAINAVGASRFAKRPEDMVGTNIYSYLPKEVRDSRKKRFEEVVRTKSPVRFVDERSGRVFENYIHPVMDSEGEVRRFAVYAMDITEARQTDKALQESEERFRTIIDASLEGIWATDGEGRTTYVNQRMVDLLGFTFDEILGRRISDFIDEEYTEIFKEKETLLREGGSHQYDLLFIRKDGGRSWGIVSSTPLFDGEGQVAGAVSMVTDVTESKHAEEEKKALQARLQRAEKMEAIGLLAGGVAHDLNNVLSGLVSYPDLLLMDLAPDSHLRDAVLTIQDSGKKAAAIVQDLLTLARRGVAVSEVVNFNDVVSEYLISAEHEKLKSFYRDAKVITDLQPDLLNILGSPVHLGKTIMNLVSNAVESLRNGGNVTISTRNQYIDRPITGYDEVSEGDYVVLTVADNGVGIASEDLKKIFEPFYTKKVMGRSGTGLGMAVVWGTVKDHNGYINVESIEGKGSTLTLYFPITRMEADKGDPPAIEKYTGKGEKLLVVDDVLQQRKIASVLLEKLGYSVDVVSSGEEAVEYMKKNAADLLVLDMIMDPGIDGLDTYKKILELHPGQRAIIASGFSETDRVKEAQRLGAGQYVKKPYTLEKIGLAVKAELSR